MQGYHLPPGGGINMGRTPPPSPDPPLSSGQARHAHPAGHDGEPAERGRHGGPARPSADTVEP
ncbi:hypothetical protein GCM10010517_28170 [Streptosporangium fragile]|uniref:Uncharacterized protein n=1 Tax=Streptosporangium fragile TaxID=46186 RepID=A0ABP6IEW9_9ACTN